jgi:hypothetical protein
VILSHLHELGYHFFSYVHIPDLSAFQDQAGAGRALFFSSNPSYILPLEDRFSRRAATVDSPCKQRLCCAGVLLAVFRMRLFPAPAGAGSSHFRGSAPRRIVPRASASCHLNLDIRLNAR